jgi:hypothetical protein
MRERPILFSGPMVRALLDGRKTQTRRVIKGVPSGDHYGRDIMDWGLSGIHQETYDPSNPIEGTDRWHLDVQTDVDDHSRRVIRCPYGARGDRLWVRETWRVHEVFSDVVRIVYGASQNRSWTEAHEDYPAHLRGKLQPSVGFKPSIHMPRWASRLTLEITDVRVERLQEISVADCYAEGCYRPEGPILGSEVTRRDNARGEYRRLWESINGAGSWAANPWVWAITFKVQP